MARAQPVLTNFTAGELAPELEGRIDLDFYANGCRTVENFLIRQQGSASYRPGLRFVAEVGDSDQPARLLGFEFSDEQAYAIELGDQTVRIFKDRGQIAVAATDAVVTNGEFTSNITGWTNRSTGTGSISHEPTFGRLNLFGGTAGVGWAEQSISHTKTGQEHVVRFRVIGVAGDSVQLRIGTTSTGAELIADRACEVGWHAVAFTPTASPFFLQFRNTVNKTLQIDDVALISGAPLELGAPYAAADLFKIRDVQSADVMFLTATGYHERRLTRAGHTTWSLTETNFIDGPWFDQNTNGAFTLQPSATSGYGITITAAGGHAPFKSTDVGRLVRILHGATQGVAIITAFTSTTVVTADVRIAFGAATAQAAWRLGLYSDTTGHPAASAFHDQRQWRGGASSTPSRLDASRVGAFDTFTPGTADDDPLAITIASNSVSTILWLSSSDFLFVGTNGGEYLVRSDKLDGAITPTNVTVALQTNHSCAALNPLQVATGVVFLQRHARKLREIAYSLEREKFSAIDLTRRARHITRPRVIDLAYQEEPEPTLWAARADGTLLACAYERDQQVIAWQRQLVGGGGRVESIAVIPGAGVDELWAIVKRTINGLTKRYVEYLDPQWEVETPAEDAFHLDSGVTLDNTIAATLTPGAGATVVGTAGVPFTAGAAVFAGGDVGKFIKYRHDSGARGKRNEVIWAVAIAEITGFTSSTIVSATIRRAFPSLSVIAASAWRLTVTQILSGLAHLEGETVGIVGDGAQQPSQVVTAGALPEPLTPAAVVHVGLVYRGRLRTMPLEGGTREGPALGKIKRASSAVARFLDTAAAKVGRSDAKLEPIIVRQVTDPMDLAPALFTGDYPITFPGNYERDADVLIVQDVPLPCTVVAVVPRFATNEG